MWHSSYTYIGFLPFDNSGPKRHQILLIDQESSLHLLASLHKPKFHLIGVKMIANRLNNPIKKDTVRNKRCRHTPLTSSTKDNGVPMRATV